MGNKIIYTLWFHVIYIFIYLSSIPLFWRRSDIDQNNIAEAIIMLLPSVFSIISLLLLNIETLSMTLCITAWAAVEFCYIDLNAGLYGGWFHVGPFNRSYYNAEHRQFKMLLLCICVFALLLNYVFVKRKVCRIKKYNKGSYKTKLTLAICFETVYTLLFLWRNSEHISFYLDGVATEKLVFRIFICSLLIAIPPLITILTSIFIIKRKQSKRTIYVLLVAGVVSNPIVISIYMYSDYYLYFFGYSVYSLLHFTGILLALSGAIEYKDCNETIN